MSVDFSLPPFRNGGGDLTMSLSPLGIVELSDEEFEVNGPRLNRYSLNWAFYLGRHWQYLRETGEPQATFNYVEAFTDYLTTFVFGRGIDFDCPHENQAIVQSRLKRVWEIDNSKEATTREIAQQGGVSGDCFIKVAYEEPWISGVDADGRPLPGVAPQEHPGRVRILPLSSQHCFPEWHPHDKGRFQRFKLKYKYYGTSPEGTRQVYTYTEVITDHLIQEFINDDLIDERPNPLGMIPIVHVANRAVSGSPWGLADCHDIVALNRLYNEVATTLVDIINYHAAPVTVILGAKASNLEKGAKKVWSIPTPNADVKNLELGENLGGPMEFLQVLKISMHEMAGVPETALGQAQPISNTSGVALAMQFQPLMQKWHAKVNQYGPGFQKVNELVLRTLAVKEPEAMVWDETTDPPLEEGQVEALDLSDPMTYFTEVHFPSPLPIDKVILLNEIQQEMSLGLESRKGAMKKLGEEFPAEKLAEIREELAQDALADGQIRLLKSQIDKEIMSLTGMMPTPDGSQLPPMDDSSVGTDASGNPTGSPTPQMPEPTLDVTDILEQDSEYEIRKRLVEGAFGTKLPQRRAPDERPEGES